MSEAGRLEEARAGNVMGKAKVEGNAEADYHSYMIRRAKLEDARKAGVITANEEKAIQSLGDLEKWELKALARLYKLADNSPELLQFLHITGSSNREEVAKKLARKQYKKQLVEDALTKLINPAEVKTTIEASASATRTIFSNIASGSANPFGLN